MVHCEVSLRSSSQQRFKICQLEAIFMAVVNLTITMQYPVNASDQDSAPSATKNFS